MRHWIILAWISATPLTAAAQTPNKLNYDEHVQPLLRDKCFSCHNQDKQRGGVALHNYTALMEGGSSGKIVEPGAPDASKLFKVIAHLEEPNMPPKSPKLADAEINLIKEWIAAGALENSGSKAKPANKPKVDVALSAASLGKPDGPPPLPPDKLTLEPAALSPRPNAITALAANPWSPLIAVGSQKSVLLYHADTLLLLGVLPFPEGMPHVLKFSRNGSLLLCGGGRDGKSGLVVLWDVRSGERVAQVGDETDAVLAADISSDQSFIALGGPSKVLRVYSTKNGEKVHEIKKHTDWVTAVEFSPDGVLLASGDRGGGLFVWEAHSGREHVTLRGHTAFITDLSWRGDSNVLASSSEDATIRLWEMENGGQIRAWGAHGGGAQGIHFGKNGLIASVGRDRAPKLWNQAGALQKQFEAFGDVALRTAITGDGQRLVAGDWSGQVHIWLIETGQRLGNLAANPPGQADQLKQLDERLAQLKPQAAQLAAQYVQADANLKKVNDEIVGLQKQAGDLAIQAKVAAETAAKAKSAAEPSVTALQAAQAALAPKDAAAKLLAEAASKAKAASEAQKDNLELAALAAQSQALLAKVQIELAAAQKYAQELAAAAQPLQQKLAQAQAAADQAQQAANAIGPAIAAKQASQKVEQDKANQLRAQLDQLNRELAALEHQRARLQTSLAQK
jgi:uncharacterized coiled-coil DUF342 family protein